MGIILRRIKMNKLVLNPKARNHFKILPFDNIVNNAPTDNGELIQWGEKLYNELEYSTNAINCFRKVNSGKGYMITVWQLEEKCYLIVSLRNEFSTDNNSIYVGTGESQKQDFINIAKFLSENLNSLSKDYKKQILDARKMYVPDINKNVEK